MFLIVVTTIVGWTVTPLILPQRYRTEGECNAAVTSAVVKKFKPETHTGIVFSCIKIGEATP